MISTSVFFCFTTSTVGRPSLRLAAFARQRCLFIQLQRLEPGAEVTAHRDALPYGGDRIATVVLEGSSQVRVGAGGWDMVGWGWGWGWDGDLVIICTYIMLGLKWG